MSNPDVDFNLDDIETLEMEPNSPKDISDHFRSLNFEESYISQDFTDEVPVSEMMEALESFGWSCKNLSNEEIEDMYYSIINGK